MAFVSTAISPIMTISTFGTYAAIAILVNYIMVITWFPAVVSASDQCSKTSVRPFTRGFPTPSIVPITLGSPSASPSSGGAPSAGASPGSSASYF